MDMNRKKHRIGIDLDGTVVNTLKCFLKEVRDTYGIWLPEDRVKNHNVGKQVDNIYINKIWAMPHIFTEAKLYEGAEKLFDFLNIMGVPYDISTLAANKAVEEAKLEMLKDYSDLIKPVKTDIKVSTSVTRKEYTGYSIIIEDSPEYITDPVRGALTFIMTRSYNAHLKSKSSKSVVFVEDYDDLIEKLEVALESEVEEDPVLSKLMEQTKDVIGFSKKLRAGLPA